MVTAPMNAKSPAWCWNTGGAAGTSPLATDRRTVPMSITVAGGDARPHLYEVGKPHTGGVEVPREINVTALADALNSQLNGAPLTDEVTVFYALIAGAVGHGIELAEQMASVS